MYGHGFRPGKPQIKTANAEIAAAEQINESYVPRVLRLTLRQTLSRRVWMGDSRPK
jgi:hypothetical protein